MDLRIDIDEELLREFEQSARAQRITRDAAVRGAITTWLSQARREAALRELFEEDVDAESHGGGQ